MLLMPAGTILNYGAGMQFLRFSLRSRGLVAAAAITLFASSCALRAQEPASTKNQTASSDSHLVSPSQLDSQVQTSTATRHQQVEGLTRFLSTPQAEKAMKDAKIDPAQVKTAIPTLSDAELAQLSARADKAQHDFAAGGLSTLALALIIIAVVLIILLAAYH
ncbi:MAG TPA: hypothetical protein VHE33_07570 [Acidobacteriaceae bacterium]|nr:hypothetical protein [Acidobacteriaceae bacterium]